MNLNIRLSNVFFSVLMQATFIVLVVAGIFAQPPTPTNVWSPPTPLGTPGGYVGVAGSGDFVHAVFSQFEPTPVPTTPSPTPTPIITSASPIMYRKSLDEGANFASATPIPGAFGALYLEDTVMTDGNRVAVVYYNDFHREVDFAGIRQVANLYITVSDNNGSSFQPPMKLNTGTMGFALRHSIAISGMNIHVVWMDFRDNKWDVYYRRSLNGGTNWEDEILLVKGQNDPGNGGSGAQRPQIAANGTTIHVAWMDGRDNNKGCPIEGNPPTILPQCTEIYYKKSITNGENFDLEDDVRLTTSSFRFPMVAYSGRPDVVTDGSNTVYVLYDKRTPSTVDNELFFRKSTDNGVTFGSEIPQTNAPGVSTHSSGVIVGSTLWTLWQDSKTTPGLFRVFSRPYDGTSFGMEQQVSTSPNAGAPILGVSANYLHAIWWNITDGTISYSRRSSIY